MPKYRVKLRNGKTYIVWASSAHAAGAIAVERERASGGDPGSSADITKIADDPTADKHGKGHGLRGW